jgi:hypothetical protein
MRNTSASFLYMISPTLNTSPPTLTKCLNSCGRKFFWLAVQPVMQHSVYLFIRSKFLSPQCLLERSKHVIITWGKIWWVRRMWQTLKMQVFNGRSCCAGSMRPSIVMVQNDTCRQQSKLLWFYCRSKMVLQQIWIRGTSDCVPPSV